MTVPTSGPDPTRSDEIGTKIDAVRSWLDSRRKDAVLIGSQAGFAWITAGGRNHVSTGEEAGVASVMITRKDAFVLTTNIERQRILDEELGGVPFETVDHAWHEPDARAELIRELCDPSAAVSDLEAVALEPAGASFAELRYVMSRSEIGRYRSLGRDAVWAVETACREIRAGETELHIAARVAAGCVRHDILPLVDLVGSDERIARYRHPIPTAKPVARSVLVALTGRRHGLHASLTRMVSLGPPDPDLAARHDAVVRVDAAVIAATRPGVPMGTALGAGLDRYAVEGFPDEWRLHHQGGPTGYAGREIFVTPSTERAVEADTVFAWNPSITRVKSEDTILVTDDGFEVLTESGEWPHDEVEVSGAAVRRPAMLVFE